MLNTIKNSDNKKSLKVFSKIFGSVNKQNDKIMMTQEQITLTDICINTNDSSYSAKAYSNGSYFLEYEKCETSISEGVSTKWIDEINRHFKDKSSLESFIGKFDAYTPFEGKHLPEYSSDL